VKPQIGWPATVKQSEHGGGPSPATAPRAHEVHLWRVNLDAGPDAVAQLRQLLSPNEKQRADVFLKPADQTRYTVTRAALRKLLGRYGNVPADRIEFTLSVYGKPGCRELLPIDFNVTHSGSLALIAIAHDQSVGVDIERIRTDLEFLEMGKLVFTPSELNDLAQRPADRLAAEFFDLWVRKEAYLKCSGEGFMGSPETIHLGLKPSNGPSDSTDANRRLQSIDPGPEYAAAFAVEKGWSEMKFLDWNIGN
jgi:4'-phosphopantetheinyl transferase